jgi:hypothetical protein
MSRLIAVVATPVRKCEFAEPTCVISSGGRDVEIDIDPTAWTTTAFQENDDSAEVYADI